LKVSILPSSLPTFFLEEEADHFLETGNSGQCAM